jgi:hypothetical protein
MFYCVEIRKALLTCFHVSVQHGVTRSYVWVCTLQNVYVRLHVPFVSQLAETLRWKLSKCRYHITVSWSVDVSSYLFEKHG